YEDEEDRLSSPFDLPNSTPFSWSWLSTINRVNTQVQKVSIFPDNLHYPQLVLISLISRL
ncbi:hypothetical protein M422DRAFT_166421, partial [Sphaerobolus stellatus SS14]